MEFNNESKKKKNYVYYSNKDFKYVYNLFYEKV